MKSLSLPPSSSCPPDPLLQTPPPVYLPYWGLLGWVPLGESLGAGPGFGGAGKERQAAEQSGLLRIEPGQGRPLAAAVGIAQAGLGMVVPHRLGGGDPGFRPAGIGWGRAKSRRAEVGT